jgi:hypothetical protein
LTFLIDCQSSVSDRKKPVERQVSTVNDCLKDVKASQT